MPFSIPSTIRSIKALLRWEHWYDSKLPLFFVLGYTLLSRTGLNWNTFIICLRLLGFAAFFLALGYAANDFSDRAVDHRAGKSNAMRQLPEPVAIGSLVFLFLLGLACLPYKTPSALALAGLAYFFGLFYSLPPLRFKERRACGLLAAAAAQRSLPALLFFDAFGAWGLDSLLFCTLYLFIGLRGILGHQIWDREHDLQTGVHTYATEHPIDRLHRLLKLIFLIEAGLLAGLVSYQARTLAGLPALLGAYLVWLSLQIFRRWRKGLPISPYTPPWLPMHGFYFIVWPVGLAVSLALRQPLFWFVVILNLFWQQWGIRQEWAVL